MLAAHKAPPFLTLLVGDNAAVGQPMLEDRRIPLVSATGSVGMGRTVAEVVGRRLGRAAIQRASGDDDGGGILEACTNSTR